MTVTENLLSVLTDPSASLVSAYFDPSQPFAGSTFDTLGDNDPNQLGIDDLLAVTLLDVSIKPIAMRNILERDQDEIHRKLVDIGPDTDLWTADPRSLDAAADLWQFLRDSYKGIDWVIAGKLLARKRPRLVPIVDSIVVAAVGAETGTYWATFSAFLADESNRAKVEALRPDISNPISTLRLLDVALWMRHSKGRNATAARRACGLDA